MYNTGNDIQTITSPSGGSVSEGNLTNLLNSSMADDGSFHRLTSGSAPIGAGIGTYSFLTQDILEGERGNNFDAGAEEFGANGTNLPFEAEDVGVNIGFGASQSPTLSAPSTLNYGIEGGPMTFEIISNVDWTISENESWLSLDLTSGSGIATITATTTENNTGGERTANITISQVAGGADLTATISVIQSNTFEPAEIQITGTSSIGMQIKDGIEEINAYNDDNSNYWTGDPGVEPEVSITFDLGCIHTLTEIGINFWKADKRTTTFSIAVADDAAGPFTIILDSAVSAASGVTVDTEQFFNLDGAVGRYVKFIGIGNSSSTNWTSIANVNIYGNVNCETTTGVFDNEEIDLGITLFPVPVTNDVLNIVSDAKPLTKIEVYNVAGQRVLTTNGSGLFSKQIAVDHLNPGIYFIQLEKIGQAKFIIR